MKKKRMQLTLFIPETSTEIIEKIRKKYNTIQNELIKSHVTICREDELEHIERVITNLENLHQHSIDISFGDIVRFDNGKGLMLSAKENNEAFINLRKEILTGIIEVTRNHVPHITLMHSRNSTCTDDIFIEIKNYRFPNKISFNKISLIEQEMGMPWKIIKEFELKSSC